MYSQDPHSDRSVQQQGHRVRKCRGAETCRQKDLKISVWLLSEREMFDPYFPNANTSRARFLVRHMSNQCEKEKNSNHKVDKKKIKKN
jgi:hypothetical protein